MKASLLAVLCWAARSSSFGFVPSAIATGLGSRPLPRALSLTATRAEASTGGDDQPTADTTAPPEPGLKLPLSALSPGLTVAIESAAALEMQELVSAGQTVDLKALELDEEELQGHRVRLLQELGDIAEVGLVFLEDGAPSHATLGLALVLTARRAAELNHPSVAALVAACESGAQPAALALAARARLALATAVEETLAEMEAKEQFTDASSSASVSVNDAPEAQTMEEARSMHFRWAVLEMARARFAEDRPADWGG